MFVTDLEIIKNHFFMIFAYPAMPVVVMKGGFSGVITQMALIGYLMPLIN